MMRDRRGVMKEPQTSALHPAGRRPVHYSSLRPTSFFVIVRLDKRASGRMLCTCTRNQPIMERPFITCAHALKISLGESEGMSRFAAGSHFMVRRNGQCASGSEVLADGGGD